MNIRVKRVLSFLAQTFIWVPLALVINGCAVAPIMMLTGEMGEPTNIFIFLPIMWAIAFALSKFRQWLKGRETDEYYDVAYDEVTYTAEATSYDTIRVNADHRYYTQTESSNTFWGWVGIILSFVALPLQIVAWIMSFAGMFFPFIYTTARALPEDRSFSFINVVLHTLFDFVIIPMAFAKRGKPSAKGLLYCLLFISVPVVDLLAWILLGGLLSGLIGGIIPFAEAALIAFLIGAVLALCIVMLLIKYSVLIVASCSRVDAKKYMRKLGRLSMILGFLLFIAIIA